MYLKQFYINNNNLEINKLFINKFLEYIYITLNIIK